MHSVKDASQAIDIAHRLKKLDAAIESLKQHRAGHRNVLIVTANGYALASKGERVPACELVLTDTLVTPALTALMDAALAQRDNLISQLAELGFTTEGYADVIL